MSIRGVNLGGWLVLERWITPELFAGLSAQDEYTFCQELGSAAKSQLNHHWQSYITQTDFDWLAEHGITAVRIPVGYWIFGSVKPYIGSIEHLDRAFAMAKQSGIKVLICLHGAPGSQNGFDHSGRTGKIDWHHNKENIQETLHVIELLAKRYGQHSNLLGIELLNEPHWDVPISILTDYYIAGYNLVKKYVKDDTLIVFHDGFRPGEWNHLISEDLPGLVIDRHQYFCFSDQDKQRTPEEHLANVKQLGTDIHHQTTRVPVIVGEWSLGIDPQSLRGLSDEEKNTFLQQFGEAQVRAYNNSNGWFFWTYKTSDMPGWSFVDCVNNGHLPSLKI